jgi:hypothetical protein
VQRIGRSERVGNECKIAMQGSPRPARSAKQSAARRQSLNYRTRNRSVLPRNVQAQAHQQSARGSGISTRQIFKTTVLIEPSQCIHAAASTPQQVLVCGSTGRRRPVLLASSRLARKNQFMCSTCSNHFSQSGALSLLVITRLLPNPSLKLSTNGVSRWSSGAGPAAHFAPAAQRATPLAPA